MTTRRDDPDRAEPTAEEIAVNVNAHAYTQHAGPLSAAEVEAFFEVGFVVARAVFGRDDVAAMRAAFERLEATARALVDGSVEPASEGAVMHRGAQFVLGDRPDGAGPGGQIQRIVWCGAAEPALLRYGADPRLLAMAGQLLGSREMDQLINQAHFKRPGDGVAFPWHQDSRHRRYGTPAWEDVNGRGSFVEIVTALDPMGPDNGPLAFIPGSCRAGHLATDDNDALPADAFDPSDAVIARLEPGDAVLFGPYTIHGSAPNRGEHPRRSFLNGYAFPGANRRVYPGEGSGRRLSAPTARARRGDGATG